jgi:hypothetical protein
MLHNKFLSIMLILIVVLSYGLVASAQDEILELTILEDGAVIEGFLSMDEQAMLYVFNANEGDEVTISMVQTTSDLDPYLALLGPAGSVLAINDDADIDNGDLSSLIEEVELPETGTYFIIASSYEFITTLVDIEEEFDGDLTFELSISGITPVKDMSSDFLFFAAELLSGEPLDADIAFEQPAWYFIFSGDEGDVIDLSAVSDDFDTIIHLFAPGGPRLAVNDDIDREGGDYNSALQSLELPADGVYFVMVSNPFVFQGDIESDDPTLYGSFTIELSGARSSTSK